MMSGWIPEMWISNINVCCTVRNNTTTTMTFAASRLPVMIRPGPR